MSAQEGNAALDEGFFDGRMLVEILTWDCPFHLGLSDDRTPRKYRFQGGATFTRGFDLEVRVMAPKSIRGREFRLHLSPLAREARFGRNKLEQVGQIIFHDPTGVNADSIGTLFIPESSIATVATCLSTVWKYLHIWMFDADAERAEVSAYSFSRDVHQNLRSWAEGV